MALTEILSDFAYHLKYENLPEKLVNNIKLHILDALSVGFHASTLPPVNPVIKVVKGWEGSGISSVFGNESGFPGRYAALINSIMFIASGYIETHGASLAHPSSPVFTTALAIGEEESADGKEFVSALIAGYEVFLRMCTGVNPSLLKRGIQTTGGIAPIGAAIVCGKLIRLSQEQMKHALNLAVNFSGSGLVEAHGAKPYFAIHVGTSIWKGILAALLAKEGAVGCNTILEGGSVSQKGFLQAYTDDYDVTSMTQGLGEKFEILQTAFTIHCVATFSRTPIDATLALVKEHAIRVDEIKSIHVKITNVLSNFLRDRMSSAKGSAMEAYFYLPFHIALTLLKGGVNAEMYTDENFYDPKIRSIMEKVQFRGDPKLDEDYDKSKSVTTSLVELRTHNDKIYTKKINHAKGSPENPLTKEELQEKFKCLASKIIPQGKVQRIIELVDHIDELKNIRTLGKLIRRTPCP